MPYTLMKGLVWVLLAVILGIVIGWLLRSVAAKRQVTRARAEHVDNAEVERLRGRLANLEPIVAERDLLKAELGDCRAARDPALGPPGEPPIAEQGRVVLPSEGLATAVDDARDTVGEGPMVAPDVGAAAAVLGRPITLDDLQVVEGIGPTVEELCHGIGIRTWFDLSTTETSLLRTMLADAGSRFQVHDPATWPEQAGLLAAGRWDEFAALTGGPSGGSAVD